MKRMLPSLFHCFEIISNLQKGNTTFLWKLPELLAHQPRPSPSWEISVDMTGWGPVSHNQDLEASVCLSLFLGPGAFEGYKQLFYGVSRTYHWIQIMWGYPLLIPSCPGTEALVTSLDSWSGGFGQASLQSYFPLVTTEHFMGNSFDMMWMFCSSSNSHPIVLPVLFNGL